jgi:hypothetical protein
MKPLLIVVSNRVQTPDAKHRAMQVNHDQTAWLSSRRLIVAVVEAGKKFCLQSIVVVLLQVGSNPV